MKLFISDLHFGHENIIKHDQRPFSDVTEMDNTLIKLWNNRVNGNDDVFIVGDFCFRSKCSPIWYLEKLKGHKHLIVGNHDDVTLKCPHIADYLESIELISEIKDNGQKIELCHYPLADWKGRNHGSLHIYGHIHGRKEEVYEYMQSTKNAYNAAACINNYTPASLEEIIRNNLLFQTVQQ